LFPYPSRETPSSRTRNTRCQQGNIRRLPNASGNHRSEIDSLSALHLAHRHFCSQAEDKQLNLQGNLASLPAYDVR
jgi:hypothetical protein